MLTQANATRVVLLLKRIQAQAARLQLNVELAASKNGGSALSPGDALDIATGIQDWGQRLHTILEPELYNGIDDVLMVEKRKD